MTAKHTPGPWEVDHDAIYCAGSGDTIAEIDFARDEYSANARLIAASPDLLEALEAMVADCVALAESVDAGFWDAEKHAPVIKARTAIAKAKGERA